MIKRYSDHAANERTFLAWVRTAIAVMAFGFVIERFDLFLQLAAPQLALKQAAPHGQMLANAAGLAFIRHRRGDDRHRRFSLPQTAKDIETENAVPSPGERSDLALAVLLVLLGLALFLYLSRAVLPGSDPPACLRGGALRDKRITARHPSRRKRSRQPTRSFDGRPHSAPGVPGAYGALT